MALRRITAGLAGLILLLLLLLPAAPAAAATARIGSDGEFLDALAAFREKKAVGFRVTLTKDYFRSISDSNFYAFVLLALKAGMEDYSLQYTSGGELVLDDVAWKEPRVAECATEAEITEAIRRMGAEGASSFDLVLDRALFEAVSADGFAKLQELEADAGLSSRELKYDPEHLILMYSAAVLRADAVRLASMDEVYASLRAGIYAGRTGIDLFCSPEIYALLIGEKDEAGSRSLINEAAVHSGIFRYTVTYSGVSRLVTVNIEKLYAGTKLLAAVAMGHEPLLTEREAETLAAARQLAEQCRSGDPLTTARLIHDALCERITYAEDESTEEDDMATGALLNGQANCDGYADAFLLTGTLAGLEVRCQQGDSREKGPDDQYSDVLHLWNLMKINGSWRLVDVTWDDREIATVHTWFNLGEDRARLMHVWNEDASVPLLPETDPEERPEYEYPVRKRADAAEAVRDARGKGCPFFSLVLTGDRAPGTEEILEVLRRNVKGAFTYEWLEYMGTMIVRPEGR